MTGMWENSNKIMFLFILGSDLFHMAVGQKSFPFQMHLEISQDAGDSGIVGIGCRLHHNLDLTGICAVDLSIERDMFSLVCLMESGHLRKCTSSKSSHTELWD